MSVNLDDIKNFLVVSKSLNITRASEIAGISQPTMSYSIKRLEKELNGKLLIRLKNGVKLTKLGENFKDKSQTLINKWTDLNKLISIEKGEIKGNYSIGLHPSVGLYTLEHFLPFFKKTYPEINFSLHHGLSREITEQVINWELDFGIVVNPKKHPDLIIKKICTDKVGVFSNGKKNNYLIYDDNLNQTQSILDKLNKTNYYPKNLTTKNLEIVAKLSSIGYGDGILPQRVAQSYENLKLIHKDYFFNDSICLVYRHEKHKNISGKTVISGIIDNIPK